MTTKKASTERPLFRSEIFLYLTGKLGVDKKDALEFLERFTPLSQGRFTNGGEYCRRGHAYSHHGKDRAIKQGDKTYFVRVCKECKRLAKARWRERQGMKPTAEANRARSYAYSVRDQNGRFACNPQGDSSQATHTQGMIPT